jgi:hypothetical protein
LVTIVEGLSFTLLDRGSFIPAPTVHNWRDVPADKRLRFTKAARGWDSDTLFRFDFALPVVGFQFGDDGLSQEFTDEQKVEQLDMIEKEEARSEVVAVLKRLFLAMNVAAPGAAQLVEVLAYSDDDDEPERSGLQYPDVFEFARTRAIANGWPDVTVLPLQQVWRWMQANEGFVDGYGSDAVGRALGALSHLLSAPDSPIIMFWAMVGVESLFTTGETGLLHQVRERSQLVLGRSKRAAALLSRMYKNRSKFVHGKVAFNAAYGHQDFYAAKEQREMREASEVAAAVLLATVQHLIARSWCGLSFATVVEGAPSIVDDDADGSTA